MRRVRSRSIGRGIFCRTIEGRIWRRLSWSFWDAYNSPSMNFIEPKAEELIALRADPLLWEQELDVRPAFAEAIEQAVGKRAGRVYWRSAHQHLYALELADLGRGRPSMAM